MQARRRGDFLPAVGRFCCWVIFFGSMVRLDAATTVTEISEDTSNLDGVAEGLERRKRLEGMFSDWKAPKWVESYRKTRDEWLERIGLDIGANYDVAGLAAYGGGAPVYGLSGDLTVGGVWYLFGKKWDRPMNLRFRVRSRHAIGGRPASGVAEATGGVIWNMIDGFSDAGFEIPDFQLVQHFRNGMELHYGQMTIDSQFDAHGLRSSKQAFFNRAFSSNPAVAFPRFGAGVTMRWKPEGRKFDLTLGTTTVQGTQNGDQVNLSFGSSDFFKAAQFGYDFKICGNPSRGQIMVWQSDAVEDAGTPSGHGASLTFEHWLASSGNRLFARAAWADSSASDADRLLSAGFAMEHRENDLFGVAVGTGRDSLGRGDWQAVIESFYRIQIGPSFHITPEAQLVFGNGLGPDHSVRIVAGIRAALSF